MNFATFSKEFQKNATKVLEHNNLFVLRISGEDLWETYLESFPAQHNQVYRERREMDCNCCKRFISHFGALVAVDEKFQVVTLWDFDTNDDKYQPMIEAMRELVGGEIERAFFSKEATLGTPITHEMIEGESAHTWNHFYLHIPNKYVASNPAEAQEERRAVKQVFRRGMEEISQGAIETVLELIDENILYRGNEWKTPLENFLIIHKKFHAQPDKNKDRFAWRVSSEVGDALAKIKNHSIGTLLINLTEGMELDAALRQWESIMAPTNYRRPKEVFTKKMVEDAKRLVVELGIEESLPRRFAKLTDITVNDVLWVNRSAVRPGTSSLGVFDELADEQTWDPKKFKGPIVSFKDFLANMGRISTLEILMEGSHTGNLVSLIAPVNKDAPALMKWGNNFSWAYRNNVTDSMKEKVKEFGGNVNGWVRFSILWNTSGNDFSDLDAHCQLPNHSEVFFGRKKVGSIELDVDIINPGGEIAVENITTQYNPGPGTYKFYVHQYNFRNSQNFQAEFEIGGELYQFDYDKPVKGNVGVCSLTIYNDGSYKVDTYLTPTTTISSKEIWGIKTNVFQPVSCVMFSPNHWENSLHVGNLHVIFAIASCKNDETPNGFFNEFLDERFTPYRKVFSALGGKMKVEPSDTQVSGLGFNDTTRNHVFVRADKRIIKIMF